MLCTYCNKEYGGRGGLSNHLRVKHPAEYCAQLEFEIEAMKRRLAFLDEQPFEEGGAQPETTDYEVPEFKVKVSMTVKPLLNPMEYETQDRELFLKEMIHQIESNPDNDLLTNDAVRHQLLVSYDQEVQDLHEKNTTRPDLKYTTSTMEGLHVHYNSEIEQASDKIKKCNVAAKAKDSGGLICETCGKSYKNKGGLTTHIMKSHPDEYEKVIEKEEREFALENASKYPKAWPEDKLESSIQINIARRKYELYLMHDRVEDALEQFRAEITIAIEYAQKSRSFDQNHDIPNIIRNCSTWFVTAVKKHYKETSQQEDILEKMEMVKASFK